MKRLFPNRVEIGAELSTPMVAYDVIAGLGRLIGHCRQQFVGRLAFVQRLNERLNDRDGAVVSTRIAPGFEIMRFGDMPVAVRRSFVILLRQMHPEWNFL